MLRLWLGVSALAVSALAVSALGYAASVPEERDVLFSNVNVVGMVENRVDVGRDVLVSKGRIARIAPTGTVDAEGALVVEGQGRFLMPGLAEMHAHVPQPPREQEAEDVLLLFVAHGVTTIRGMLGDPWHLKLRERLARHEVLGPRLYTAGPSFNGETVPTPERAVARVREQVKAGYDFLKLHPGLKRDVFDAIVAAAHSAGITFQGHVSEDVGVLRALEARQRAIDHMDGYVAALVNPECLDGPVSPGIFGMGLAHCADPGRIPELAGQTKAAGTWMVPTAILLEQWARPPSREELLKRPVMRYLPPDTVSRWQSGLQNFIGAGGADEARAQRYIEIVRGLLKEMHAQGVPILLGSDAPQVFNAPGDSALAELALYADIGLEPFAALQTATVNPARFFSAADRFGTVREGLEADLILIDANPLENVKAVRELSGVMLRGRWLPRGELDARLEALAARQ